MTQPPSRLRTKRITLTISGNIESIKMQLQDELGVELSYTQVVDILIKNFRKSKPAQSLWQPSQSASPSINRAN
jgi:hypothetical protein